MKAAINITTKVTGYPLSYASSVYLGSVNRKLKTITLTMEESRLYILWSATTDMRRTPRMYTVIMFTSVNPR